MANYDTSVENIREAERQVFCLYICILTSGHKVQRANEYSCAKAGRLTNEPGRDPQLTLGMFARFP